MKHARNLPHTSLRQTSPTKNIRRLMRVIVRRARITIHQQPNRPAKMLECPILSPVELVPRALPSVCLLYTNEECHDLLPVCALSCDVLSVLVRF
jgi:hypothetical protein